MPPPRGSGTWRRPYTAIYNDNYRYGTGLYSGTLSDIEKRYSDSLSRTQLRADRPDLGFSTFAGSGLGASASPAEVAPRRTPDPPRPSPAALSSSVDEVAELLRASRPPLRRPLSLYEDWSPLKEAAKGAAPDDGARSTAWRQKSLYEECSLGKAATKVDIQENGPKSASWRQKSRALLEELESLENNVSSCDKRLQSELSSLKSRCQSEVTDLNSSVELTSQQVSDLQRLCKRQSSQITGLQSAYEDAQSSVQDALDEVSLWQNRCKGLKKDMDRLREELEMTVLKTTRSKED